MLKCIVAVSTDGCIDIPTPKADRDRFAMLTIGHTCLVGRTTWATLPPAARRNRTWVTASKYPLIGPSGSAWTTDPVCYAEGHRHAEDIWLCGGGQLYKALLPSCEMIYLTRLRTGGGTIKFPDINFDLYDSLFSRDFEDHVFEILRIKP